MLFGGDQLLRRIALPPDAASWCRPPILNPGRYELKAIRQETMSVRMAGNCEILGTH